MHIHCHQAEILHMWCANNGRLLSGTVLVEFTLYDEKIDDRPLRSQLVENISLHTEHCPNETLKARKLEQQAYEQVRRYFDGEGNNENLFADGLEGARVGTLSAEQEVELQAELRAIELEFDQPDQPAPANPVSAAKMQPASA